MSSKKIISINPEFFTGKSLIKGRKNKTRKKKPKPIATKRFENKHFNESKKELINRFVKHKEKQKLIDMKNKLKKEEEFEDNYNQAVDFLKKRLKRRETRKRRKEMKEKMQQNNTDDSFNDDHIRNALNRAGAINTQINSLNDEVPVFNNQMEDNTSLSLGRSMRNFPQSPVNKPSVPSRPLPKYGILKGGKLPLYSERRKKLNNFISDYHDGRFDKPVGYTSVDDDDDDFKINTLNTNIKIDTEMKKNLKREEMKSKLKRNQVIRKKKTYKRKIKLGKKGGKVSVLIKNNKTRKKIKHEHGRLKTKPIEDIKRYLRRHNLIKIGSTAPDNVLRDLFETSFLSGDVYNKNKDILLHNFVLDDNDI